MGMVWDIGTAASFAHTGTGFGWWLVRVDITGRIPRFSGGEPWGTAFPHHFRCGVGLSGASLDIIGGRRCGRSGRVGKVGATL